MRWTALVHADAPLSRPLFGPPRLRSQHGPTWRILTVLAALVAGCRTPSSSSPPAAQPVKPAAPAEPRRVVVPWAVPLYTAPSLSAARIDLRDPGAPRWSATPHRPGEDPDTLIWPGPGYVMSVIGAHDDFLAVTPVVDDDGVCTERLAIEPWAVTFYVERARLPRVVTRRLTVDFADGTAVRLAPGVPLGVEVGA